jgi:hypothetical protein
MNLCVDLLLMNKMTKKMLHCQNISKIQYTSCRKRQTLIPLKHKYMTTRFPVLTQAFLIKNGGVLLVLVLLAQSSHTW